MTGRASCGCAVGNRKAASALLPVSERAAVKSRPFSGAREARRCSCSKDSWPTFRATGGGQKKKGCKIKDHGGNIKAVLNGCNDHASGAHQHGSKYKCYRDYGFSDDGAKYLSFESTFHFTVTTPRERGRVYWVRHKLTRNIILFCPEDNEAIRFEHSFDEYFRVSGSSTRREATKSEKKGSEDGQQNLDYHRDPYPYEFPCDPKASPPTYCQMEVSERGELTLEECGEDAVSEDSEFFMASDSTERRSTDGGSSWSKSETTKAKDKKVPAGMSPVTKYASGYKGGYSIEYFMVHCDVEPAHTMVPTQPGGNTTVPLPPVRLSSRAVATVSVRSQADSRTSDVVGSVRPSPMLPVMYESEVTQTSAAPGWIPRLEEDGESA